MKLSSRLKTICSLVDEGTNVIDVGCDHALIDIYLTLYNNNHCIASDINKNALNNAIDNIKKYHLEDKIDTVISNGLENIDIKPNNTVIICGMGTSTILDILKDVSKIETLIIQSNNDLYLLRKQIVKKGFYIFEDIKLEEKGIFYNIIKLKKGKKKYNYFELVYGTNYTNKEYIKNEIRKNNDIIKNIPKKNISKIFLLKIKNRYLKKKL